MPALKIKVLEVSILPHIFTAYMIDFLLQKAPSGINWIFLINWEEIKSEYIWTHSYHNCWLPEESAVWERNRKALSENKCSHNTYLKFEINVAGHSTGFTNSEIFREKFTQTWWYAIILINKHLLSIYYIWRTGKYTKPLINSLKVFICMVHNFSNGKNQLDPF